MNDILWTSVAPLWSEQSGSDLSGLGQPTILRFANDSFMDEFANVLANQPARLADYRAWPETWREPLPQPASVTALPPALREFQRKRLGASPALELVDHSDSTKPLKLYQPAHQRYYLLTSSLVCRQLGLPDRAINTSAQEKASFVIRRLMLAKPGDFTKSLPPDPDLAQPGVYNEYAFVNGNWQPVADGKSLVPGEELNPLFAVCYTQTDGRRRRMFGGLIPVGKREAYMTAGKTIEPPPAGPTTAVADPRLKALLDRDFFGPWGSLISSAMVDVEKISGDIKRMIANGGELANVNKTKDVLMSVVTQKRRQIQEASWYLLLDLSNFLDQHMNPMPNTVVSALNDIVMPGVMKTAIQNAANTYHPNVVLAGSLGDALAKIRDYKAAASSPYLETSSKPYEGFKDDSPAKWPNFLFPLVDLMVDLTVDSATGNLVAWKVELDFPRKAFAGSTDPMSLLDELRATLLAALPTHDSARLPPVPLAAQISKMADIGSLSMVETGWFVARCALERPNCLPLPQALLSDPTVAFQLAGFFDPDAPARPIRIALPVDTSPAGLRKFDKNAAFILSNILCGQVERAKKMGLVDLVLSVLPWPFHKDLDMDSTPCPDGMICSLSIPIVTICALILLIIMVSLFDYIFHWLPFLMTCFPLKKFFAKKANS